MSDRFAVLPQYLLPKILLTQFAGRLARGNYGQITTRFISWFIQRYQVDMTEAQQTDISQFASFNDFFTRALRPGIRPLAATDLICPVDGAISQFGQIEQGQIFQAKGHHYSATALLGGDAELAKQFNHGSFATIYLSPRDYHRIHMPCSGKLQQMIYVPGDLFSVNPTTARGVPGLFARNERVVCIFNSDFGQFALVLVGATIVGSMATSWHGVVNPPRPGEIRRWAYAEQDIRLEKGEEMGKFLLGSTVVLLFPEQGMTFNPAWQAAKPVKLGEAMASFL